MKRILLLFGLLLFVISVCSLFSPDDETIQAEIQQTQTAAHSATPTAEPTAAPTDEPAPTEVEEVKVEVELVELEAKILTTSSIFIDAVVYSLSFPQEDVFLVTFEVPAGVGSDYYALVDRVQ